MSSGFRLHIDIPIALPGDTLPGEINEIAYSVEHASEVIDRVLSIIRDQCPSVKEVNYRLLNDGRSDQANYLNVHDASGPTIHYKTQKCRVKM